MKKSIKVLLAVAALTTFSATAQSWTVGSSQGIDEYRVADSSGAVLNFSCDMGGSNPGDRNVFFTTPDGVDHSVDNTSLKAIVDGKMIEFAAPWSNLGASNWSWFWEHISKSKSTTFTVTMNGKKFTFPTAGAAAAFKSPGAKGCLYY